MENTELKKAVLDYMTSHHTMSLATEGGGLPHAASVFYINMGFDIYFLSSPLSRHGVNFSQNQSVSATINEDYADWKKIKGIQLEGTVSDVGGILQNGRIALAFIKKFPDVADFFSSPKKLGKAISLKVEGVKFYKLIPDRIFFINNEAGFGHKDELVVANENDGACR